MERPQQSRTFSIMLTRSCPLRCEHCSLGDGLDPGGVVSAFREDELREMILGLDPAAYTLVTLTGGEPTLFPALIEVAARACREVGLKSMVTTSPVWARTAATARRTARRLRAVDMVVLSYDSHHLHQLGAERYDNAVEACRDAGVRLAFNLCFGDDEEREELLAGVARWARHPAEVACHATVPYTDGAAAAGVVAAGRPIRSAADLAALDRSCTYGDPIVDSELALDLCCWSKTVDRSPLRVACSSPREVTSLAARLEQDADFAAVRSGGFLDSLSAEDGEEIARNALGRAFVNECHLCTTLMREGRLPDRLALLPSAAAPAAAPA